jgi:hypothetical protein
MVSSLSKWRFWSTMSIELPSLCNLQAYTNHFFGQFSIYKIVHNFININFH